MVASLVGFCVGATLTVSDFSYGALLVTGVSAGCLVVLWALLQAKIPQRITIKGPWSRFVATDTSTPSTSRTPRSRSA